MKMFVVGRRDTVIGMRLAGVHGRILEENDDVAAVLDELAQNPEMGVVLICESFAAKAREKVDFFRMNRNLPVILEIPDMRGTTRDRNYLARFVSESVGLKI